LLNYRLAIRTLHFHQAAEWRPAGFVLGHGNFRQHFVEARLFDEISVQPKLLHQRQVAHGGVAGKANQIRANAIMEALSTKAVWRPEN
jgi:hypothetical protein